MSSGNCSFYVQVLKLNIFSVMKLLFKCFDCSKYQVIKQKNRNDAFDAIGLILFQILLFLS